MTDSDLDLAIARLAAIAPDARRADRTRQLCRALLAQRQKRRDRSASRMTMARRALTPVLFGAACALCLVYVTALVATTLELQGLFH